MNPLTYVMLAFSIIGAIDRIFGNKLGLGKEFERGFLLLGNMALAMIGMIVLAPYIADILKPVFRFISDNMGLDPSFLPAMLLANDMGGAPLAAEVATSEKMGLFNALIVSSMMGATVSFTIPYALNTVKKEQYREVLLGLLCGMVTIPVGCFVSGLMMSLPLTALLWDLLPLVIFSAIVCAGLILNPELCVKIFSAFGTFIKAVITAGLAFAVVRFITGTNEAGYRDAAIICANASAVMSGAFPLIYTISKLLAKPLSKFGKLCGMNEASALGILSTLATNVTTFENMRDMDKKGTLVNSAFAVSAAFTFAGHLAYTMAFPGGKAYITHVIVGKLVAGVLALLIALLLSKKLIKQ
ncbi:MAG: ethanolamine utilization protein EutH [Clostridia bacterium]|nr:ethanolamine utilization protein EutH [Clostridia bacterium]